MHFTHTIIGAGIVGLATAYQLKKKLPDSKILVIEKESGVAKHQTGNNSGVIHSGIYYKPGSLKAVNCRKGYKQLIEFCDEFNVNYDLCGKVIVATNESELPQLDKILDRGNENGLENLTRLNESKAIKRI
jgi:L-2-hydroxyglutarate oxidase